MSVPYRFDDSVTERSGANAGLDIGVTQAILAARTVAARGDNSKGLVGIGDAGSPSQNPMQISGPLPAYAQPNVGIVNQAASVPTPHLDALNTSPLASPPYQQPNTSNPAPHPSGTVSKSNPMGL